MLCDSTYCKHHNLGYWDIQYYLQLAFQWNYLEEEDLRQQLWYIFCRNVFTNKKTKIFLILARGLRDYLETTKVFRYIHEQINLNPIEDELTTPETEEQIEYFSMRAMIEEDLSLLDSLYERYLCYLRYGCGYSMYTVSNMTNISPRQTARDFSKIYDKFDVIGDDDESFP